MGINKWFFLTEEFQLVNVERIKEIKKKSPLESAINAAIMMQQWMLKLVSKPLKKNRYL